MISKISFVLAMIATPFLALNAQHHYAEWVKTIETNGTNSNMNNLLFDGQNYIVNGSYFLSGTFNGNILQEASSANAMISKIDPDGNHIWLSQVYGDGMVSFFDMAFDSDKNIVLAGWTTSQQAVYVNGEMIIEGDGSWVNNSMVIKLSGADGSLMWHRHWTGAEYTTLNASKVAVDENDNVYVSGYYNTPWEIDGISFPYNFIFGDDVYILKFNPEGAVVWGNYWPSIDNMGFSLIRSLVVNDEALYFSLEYSLPVIVNGEPLPHTGEYYWLAVAKVSKETGEVVNINPFGTEGGQLIQQLALDNSGNIVVVGWFTAENPITIGDFTLNGYGYDDGFIFKMNSDLEVIWAKDMGGLYTDRAFNVQIDEDNTLFVGGGFDSTEDFLYDGQKVLDSRIPASLAMCYLQLHADGSFIQSAGLYGQMDGTVLSFTSAYANPAETMLEVICTGNFIGGVTFTEGQQINTDHNRGFVYKWLLPDVTSVGDLSNEATSCRIYPNPATDYLTIDPVNQRLEITLVDITGRLIFSSAIETMTTISISELPSGIYMMNMKNQNMQRSLKVIKN